MKLKFILVLVLVSVFAAACAQRPSGSDRSASLRAADRDGDGKVSREEFLTARRARFFELDRTSDGYISSGDLGRLAKGRIGDRGRKSTAMHEMDTDRDGRLSSSEFDGASERLFKKLDGDANGVLDAQEISASMRAMGQQSE